MEDLSSFFQKANQYGMQEFIEIIGELSQESTKKGALSRLQKESVALGIALHKNCHRCIEIHEKTARQVGADDSLVTSIHKVLFFSNAAPHSDSELWDDWVESWQRYSYSRIKERQQLRELVALAIAIVKQHRRQIDLHMEAALDVGLTIEEVFEVVPVTLLMDGAPALSQIPVIVKCFEAYQQKLAEKH